MLKLLLDEHVSPDVAKGLRLRHSGLTVFALTEWESGAFLGQQDNLILELAATQKITLVTYDKKTIRPLLNEWAHEGKTHGGVIFIDHKTIPSGNIGGLVHALSDLLDEMHSDDWTNRSIFLDA